MANYSEWNTQIAQYFISTAQEGTGIYLSVNEDVLVDIGVRMVPPVPEMDAVDDFERRMIREALARAQGNKSRAARLLNMRRTTFIEKLKRLSPADEGGDPLPDEQA